MRALNKKTPKRTNWRTVVRLLSLIICFPLGLYVLWTRTRWSRMLKTTVSAAVAVLLIAILLPMTNPPERETGGIHLVDEEPKVEVYGPEAPADREIIEIYAPRRTALVVQPTATPKPPVVYCNNGGKHYHSEECRFVREDTPDVTLTRAVEAGYTKCSECNAPDPY